MKTFSSRISNNLPLLNCDLNMSDRDRISQIRLRRKKSFLGDRVRKRLCFEIAFITRTSNFLEPFLIKKDLNDNTFSLDLDSLKDISLAEIGYDIAEHIDIGDMAIESKIDGTSYYDDVVLFDLIELILVFSKEEQRESLRERFKSIFNESAREQYLIRDWMIIVHAKDDVRSFLPLIKNETLRTKMESCLNENDNQARARSAADALQYVFSGDGENDTKAYSNKLIKEISEAWSSDKDKGKNLENILSKMVLNVKELNNNINNVRHTDKNTIGVRGDAIFRLIADFNISIVQLSIFSKPESYIENRSSCDIKQEYFKKYEIDPKKRKEEPLVEDIFDGIPF